MNLTNGEAWLKLQALSIEDLVPIASQNGFGLEEEMARSVLRSKLTFRRTEARN